MRERVVDDSVGLCVGRERLRGLPGWDRAIPASGGSLAEAGMAWRGRAKIKELTGHAVAAQRLIFHGQELDSAVSAPAPPRRCRL